MRNEIVGGIHEGHRKPIDNILDELELCCTMVETQDSHGNLLGVFNAKLDRKQARYIIEEFVTQKSLGKLG